MRHFTSLRLGILLIESVAYSSLYVDFDGLEGLYESRIGLSFLIACRSIMYCSAI